MEGDSCKSLPNHCVGKLVKVIEMKSKSFIYEAIAQCTEYWLQRCQSQRLKSTILVVTLGSGCAWTELHWSLCSSTRLAALLPHTWSSAAKSSIQRFVITEKAPSRSFSWLKAATATTAFTFKTLLRHYAKRALTPLSLNVGPWHNYHEGRVAIRHYANQTARPNQTKFHIERLRGQHPFSIVS